VDFKVNHSSAALSICLQEGSTCLIVATERGRADVVVHLVEWGAAVDDKETSVFKNYEMQCYFITP